jgi:hypothetical protein
MSLSFSWQAAWDVLFTLCLFAGYSIVGGSVSRRFGTVGLTVYWIVLTLSFVGGCVFALGGATLLGVLTFLPIMLCLLGLPTGMAMIQLARRQRKQPQTSSGQAARFLFARTLLLMPVGMVAAYGVEYAEYVLGFTSRG